MKLKIATLLSVAALMAPLGVRAQLAPFSREEMDSLFTFTAASDRLELSPASPSLLTTLAAGRAAEKEVAEKSPFALERLSFVKAAGAVPRPPPRAPVPSSLMREEREEANASLRQTAAASGLPGPGLEMATVVR